MDKIQFDGNNLQCASGRCVVAGDNDQEGGTSGVSDRFTTILVVVGLSMTSQVSSL